MGGENQILVLDGDDASRKELCDLLRDIIKDKPDLGFTDDDLVCSTTIDEALDFLNTGQISLVIVEAADIIRQGYSVCSLLGVSPGTQVVLKAYIDELGPINTAAIKVHGIIDKPAVRAEVLYYMRLALRVRIAHANLEDTFQAIKDTADQSCAFCPNRQFQPNKEK